MIRQRKQKQISIINLTLTPDEIYPNNTNSNFYTILPEDIILNGSCNQVALTEFHYPVNYTVSLGSFVIQIPNYLNIDNDVEFNDDIILTLDQSIDNYDRFYIELVTNEDDSSIIFKIEETAVNIDTTFNIYIDCLIKYTHFDQRLRFEYIFKKFEDFYNKNLNNHNFYAYNSDSNRNFISKIISSFEEIYNKLKSFQVNIPTNRKIEIIVKDRLSKKELLDFFEEKLKFLVNRIENKLVLKKYVKIVEFDPSLEEVASFKNDSILFDKLPFFSRIKNFSIYTDIIADSFLNDKKEPILRIVSAKGKSGDYINYIFDRPHYETINKTRISKIFIKILDQNNSFVNFTSGPVILKLEIQKKS